MRKYLLKKEMKTPYKTKKKVGTLFAGARV